ncbi:MAG: hypothetical protein JJU31_03230 [Wenzhouxiangella sp.]|nr:hypothetical protein [Wenzhouxiangella sp.]MCH8476348.1 hypothetical protein [Wenzhouxiangella sp.]
MKSSTRTLLALLALAGLLLSGCVTYSQPRYGHDGIYYDQPVVHRTTTVVHASPLIYPYWSLDYFYFSRFYHPYSVWVGWADPWYYPYPGWYHGYRPGPRTRLSIAFGGHYYPWYAHGYHGFHPWGWTYIHYPPPRSGQPAHRRHVDERLRMLEQRQRSTGVRTLATAPTLLPPDGIASSRLHSVADQGPGASERAALRRQQGEAGPTASRAATSRAGADGRAASRQRATQARREGLSAPSAPEIRSRERARQPAVPPPQRSEPVRTRRAERGVEPPSSRPSPPPRPVQAPPARSRPAESAAPTRERRRQRRD